MQITGKPSALSSCQSQVVVGPVSNPMRSAHPGFASMNAAIAAGMVLDPLIPVLLPIILPTLIAFDIDLIHFGVLTVIAVVIGQVTPPMAIALFISGRIAQVDQIDVLKANMPFLYGIIIFLLIAIAVPEVATWLPALLRD